MANAYRDQNNVPGIIASSNVDGFTPVRLYADPITHRLLVDMVGGAGVQFETPTGSVNGSNVTFTVSNTPQMIFVDGMARLGGFDYTYSGGTITFNIPPQIWVRSLY